jgi:hypothetical protein
MGHMAQYASAIPYHVHMHVRLQQLLFSCVAQMVTPNVQ